MVRGSGFQLINRRAGFSVASTATSVNRAGRPPTLHRETVQRKVDADQQPRLCILRPNMTVVHMDGALRDGQAQTNAASVRVARIVHAKEGFENLREGFRWNTRTIIANSNGGVRLCGVQARLRPCFRAERAIWRFEERSQWRGAAAPDRPAAPRDSDPWETRRQSRAAASISQSCTSSFSRVSSATNSSLQGTQIAFLPSYLQEALGQIGKLINLLIHSHGRRFAIGRGARQLGRKT